ncbi:MAG: hypothetical protein ACKO47_01715 [Alphaproteobacteria bacterium]
MILNLTILVFVIINLLIFFAVKTRTSIVISLLISCLVTILFFSQILLNYNSFKEVILALVIYAMVILNLVISDTNSQASQVKIDQKKLSSQSNHLFHKSFSKLTSKFSLAIFFLIIFGAVLLINTRLGEIYEEVKEKKYNKQNEIILNPIMLPSHPVHQYVWQNYFNKNSQKNIQFEQSESASENEFKKAQMKNELSNNFILKRASEVLIIICGIICLALINLKKNHNSQQKN